MPLVRNMPGFKTLDLEAGYRYSSYSAGFNTNTYKFGVEWAPVSDVRVRGATTRAVRVPTSRTLSAPARGPRLGGDGCATGQYTAAQCALAGLPVGLYGNSTLVSPAGQYNGLIGGNPTMKPEVGTTTNVGLVFTPSFLPHFSATLDYTDNQDHGPGPVLRSEPDPGELVSSGSATSSWV